MVNTDQNVHSQAETIADNDSELDRLRLKNQFLIAAALVMAMSAVALVIHWAFGLRAIDVAIENQVWTLLAFTLASLVAQSASNNASSILAQILSLAVSLSGLTILVGHGVAAISLMLFGTAMEEFAFQQRAFGEFAWINWLVIGILGILPIFFLWPRFRTRSWPAAFLLLMLALVAALYLRVNYCVSYSDSIPSSWHQLLWPW